MIPILACPALLAATITLTASEPLRPTPALTVDGATAPMAGGPIVWTATWPTWPQRIDATFADYAGNPGASGWTPVPIPTPTEPAPTPGARYYDGHGWWEGIAPGPLPAATYTICYWPDCATPASIRYYAGGYYWRDYDDRLSVVWTNRWPHQIAFDATGLAGEFWFGAHVTCATGTRLYLHALAVEWYPPLTATPSPTQRRTPTWTFTLTPTPSLGVYYTPSLTPSASNSPTCSWTYSPTSTQPVVVPPSRTPTATPTLSPSQILTPLGNLSRTPTWTSTPATKPTPTPYTVRLRLRAIEYRDGWMELILEPRRNQ